MLPKLMISQCFAVTARITAAIAACATNTVLAVAVLLWFVAWTVMLSFRHVVQDVQHT